MTGGAGASAGTGEDRNAERSAARRAQILGAATAVFARQGYHGARMDDIVRESGLSKGALYWYFKSKEEIAVELVRRMLQSEEDSLADMTHGDQRAAAPDPERQLHALAQAFATELASTPERAPLALELLSLGQRIPEIRTAFTQYHERYTDILTQLLTAVSRGAASERQARAGAMTLAAMADGMALHHALSPSRVNLQEQLADAIDVLIAGLRHQDDGNEDGRDGSRRD
ncbi:TetR/AcrR family transcriptional regulator [Streptomyces triticirhizae]|uniref:TetR/AcrR family transcriptional regulator n=1 Tax=Streptomyces triticirhizae TaxID=2483353 RepID=A0A3M2MC72_9ACTN|nr:TetR/AcrR family transcriptional regulator [Streptomyces triticirhizae]RMI44798.1 TetR/AcrR family transcriptional regulator [Streptomyces triticirhizae]